MITNLWPHSAAISNGNIEETNSRTSPSHQYQQPYYTNSPYPTTYPYSHSSYPTQLPPKYYPQPSPYPSQPAYQQQPLQQYPQSDYQKQMKDQSPGDLEKQQQMNQTEKLPWGQPSQRQQQTLQSRETQNNKPSADNSVNNEGSRDNGDQEKSSFESQKE